MLTMKSLAALLLPLVAITSIADAAHAAPAIKSEPLEYTQGDQKLEGYLAFPEGKKNLPAVILVHDWMGMTENVKERALQVAGLGYVALAADIYGKGNQPKDGKEASGLAGKFKADRTLLRARAKAALDVLIKTGKVNSSKIIVLGYCFGGTTALELARSGADLRGVVSFHGGLATPNPADAKAIKGRVLVMHGADDPFVKAEEVAAFEKEMRDAGLDWELIKFGGAVHSFTIKDAGNDPSKGAAYNEKADHRSWEELKRFLADVVPLGR